MFYVEPRSHTRTLCSHRKLHALQIVVPHVVFLRTKIPHWYHLFPTKMTSFDTRGTTDGPIASQYECRNWSLPHWSYRNWSSTRIGALIGSKLAEPWIHWTSDLHPRHRGWFLVPPRSHTGTLCSHQKLHALQFVAPQVVFVPTKIPHWFYMFPTKMTSFAIHGTVDVLCRTKIPH